tara:strand:- start:2881 stop:3621 length:741 start_codon:yes stop_codon:yes gene_type:complete
MKDKVTILIQGPLNSRSINNIQEYLKFGKVVVSHWDDDDTTLLDNYVTEDADVKVVSQSLKKYEGGVWDHTPHYGTFHLACKTTYHGLKEVDTEYVIKTRSDERFSNLQPMIDLCFESDKIVWGNIWALKRSAWSAMGGDCSDPLAFHIGDHIFMDKTERLMKTYDLLFSDVTTHDRIAELGLSRAYMRANDFGNVSEAYKIIDINAFDDWVVRLGVADQTFRKDEGEDHSHPRGHGVVDPDTFFE